MLVLSGPTAGGSGALRGSWGSGPGAASPGVHVHRMQVRGPEGPEVQVQVSDQVDGLGEGGFSLEGVVAARRRGQCGICVTYTLVGGGWSSGDSDGMLQ